MSLKYIYLLPPIYFILAVLFPFLGPLGLIIPLIGIPMNFIVNDWYVQYKYGDPTFPAILGGTFQYLIIGFLIDLLRFCIRRQNK